MTARITLRGFGWRYAGRRDWALRGIDLRIEAGERVLLLGASGAGKSTLLLALAGLLAADSGDADGELTVDGRAGVLFQDPSTQLVMARSGDDVAFGLENLAIPYGQIWPRVDAALADVGLPYGRDRPTTALSGGEQQRLALAGVLAMRPALLLLDEPTANLDPAGAALIRQALATAVPADCTTVLIEHRVASALPLIDRVVVLSPDGVIADGAPAQVFAAQGAALAAAGVWVPDQPVISRPATGPAGPALLQASRVRYRHPGADRDALAATSLTVEAARATAVTGPNGSGKSTLARLLGGLTRPTGGVVEATAALAGDAATDPYRWPATALAARIGSVFQNPEHQFITRTVRAELALGPQLQRRAPLQLRGTVDALLDRLHLAHLADANPHTLSGGQARRLSVGTVLAAAPRLLILDEPTFGQDRRTWLELVALLAEVRDYGRAIVTVTHDEALVEALADVVVPVAAPA